MESRTQTSKPRLRTNPQGHGRGQGLDPQGQGLDSQGQSQDQGLQNCPRGRGLVPKDSNTLINIELNVLVKHRILYTFTQ